MVLQKAIILLLRVIVVEVKIFTEPLPSNKRGLHRHTWKEIKKQAVQMGTAIQTAS
jgi:hypothetical protein